MEYITKTNLILPFKGTWMVSNGGRTVEVNNHMKFKDAPGPQNQIYAYDFRLGYRGEGRNVKDYEVYGREVLSPGEGEIIQVIDGSIDVSPGERDRSVGVGNAIIINHKNGEFSLLCHLKHKSIKVKVGDNIKQGDLIGLCGNTGNTSQPHIHFNLQDGPFMHKAGPLPAQFTKILVNGELKKNYEPVRKQYVSNIV